MKGLIKAQIDEGVVNNTNHIILGEWTSHHCPPSCVSSSVMICSYVYDYVICLNRILIYLSIDKDSAETAACICASFPFRLASKPYSVLFCLLQWTYKHFSVQKSYVYIPCNEFLFAVSFYFIIYTKCMYL